MNRWFRFYSDALDNLKVQKLPAHLFKSWVNILCLASANSGVIPSIDEVAFRLRLSTHDAQANVDELILAGLIDIKRTGELTPHNWETRQYVSDTSSVRVRKHRKNKKENKRNVSETLHGTAPDTEADTDTESEAEVETLKQEIKYLPTSLTDTARAKVQKGSGQIEYTDLKVRA